MGLKLFLPFEYLKKKGSKFYIFPSTLNRGGGGGGGGGMSNLCIYSQCFEKGVCVVGGGGVEGVGWGGWGCLVGVWCVGGGVGVWGVLPTF